jgi:hypothetical protein
MNLDENTTILDIDDETWQEMVEKYGVTPYEIKKIRKKDEEVNLSSSITALELLLLDQSGAYRRNCE